jgi:pyruvate, water dikinase
MASRAQSQSRYIRPFKEVGMGDIAVVGGKNASLGEMISELTAKGVMVPDGFATTAQAFRDFLDQTGLQQRITTELESLDLRDTQALHLSGERIRGWILDATLPTELQTEVLAAYRALCVADAKAAQAAGNAIDAEKHTVTVAVRSSATAEDLPDASFAGQQETYLGVQGEEQLLRTVRRVMASLYTDRAIVYRATHGFAHDAVALSVGVQKMVRSDVGASGVLFTCDTESGFRDVCLITAAYGLGETVVQGSVTPDEWLVFKPLLSQCGARPIVRRTLGAKATKMVYNDDRVTADATMTVAVDKRAAQRFCLNDNEVLQLAQYGVAIEAHYSAKAGCWRPMDIEWAKDGITNELFVVQARPETVHSAAATQEGGAQMTVFRMDKRALKTARVLCEGKAVGNKVGTGRARVILEASNMEQLQQGEVLVTEVTNPDWLPCMQKASAIVTARGGRVCHAAIVARELGLPCVVGASHALHALSDGQEVTVVCSEGDNGVVYEGTLPFTERLVDTAALEQPKRTRVSLILGNPSQAFSLAQLPVKGVGLVRLEFIIANGAGVHPNACLDVDTLDPELQRRIRDLCVGSTSPVEHYTRSIAEGVATICAAFFPEQCIVRLSDFKTNEYARLIGGDAYESSEDNPMLGFRGASRYYSPRFERAFALECEALRRVREDMGLVNCAVMVPFVRSTTELERVLDCMARNGLQRGINGLRVFVMCEVPTNALLADDFLNLCDGFSIGSNDLTQLTLGIDRSSVPPDGLDERNESVQMLIGMAIDAARRSGKYVGICGQAPSDYPDFARWLVERGIDSISLNADAVASTLQVVADAEKGAITTDAKEE